MLLMATLNKYDLVFIGSFENISGKVFKCYSQSRSDQLLNPFVPNVLFLYPLKTTENCKDFLCFQGVEKGCIGNKWVKHMLFVFYGFILCVTLFHWLVNAYVLRGNFSEACKKCFLNILCWRLVTELKRTPPILISRILEQQECSGKGRSSDFWITREGFQPRTSLL